MHTQKTLATLLSSPDRTIYRNAQSILKRLQNCPHERYYQNIEYYNGGQRYINECTVCGILKPQGMR